MGLDNTSTVLKLILLSSFGALELVLGFEVKHCVVLFEYDHIILAKTCRMCLDCSITQPLCCVHCIEESLMDGV